MKICKLQHLQANKCKKNIFYLQLTDFSTQKRAYLQHKSEKSIITDITELPCKNSYSDKYNGNFFLY